MIIVAILTWIAFFAILAELNWRWTYGTHHMWHSIMGVIVLVCAFLAVCIEEELLFYEMNLFLFSQLWVFYGQPLVQNGIVVGIGSIG